MPRQRFDTRDLPEGHQIVLELLARLDKGHGVTWERLREAAARKGIGEHELDLILHGKRTRGGA